ncbi:AlbA family DNA-binding domain-containing protein [Rhizobium tropici]|uniref:AlbA family DNA-binding domain-containing protein n=1 Tax=Rhizobium tropici TaxID=398 RepID=UPI0009D980B4|nr:ATP-binding protein [Rhizobium tropici]
MFAREFDDIALSDLQALVEEGIPEGRQLEFKRDHYGRKDEDRREFAADVSAMANAVGGYLVIGLDERNGIASDVSGVATPDPDGLVRAVSDTIRTSFEPPILEFRVKWIAIEGERGVLVIKMARSWSAPPRVNRRQGLSLFHPRRKRKASDVSRRVAASVSICIRGRREDQTL